MAEIKPTYKRLDSLDILRGFDLFMLIMVQGLCWLVANNVDIPWFQHFCAANLEHVVWEGFCAWDMVMPLFMFMAGVSMPFAFASYLRGEVPAGKMYWRITRRLILLWLLGMLVQGNLLDLDWHTLRFFSNTLQAIAIGYFFTAIIVMNVRKVKWQVVITVALLAIFWICMALFGDYTPRGNFADKVDALLLGHWRDCMNWNELTGEWEFWQPYTYTWIFSSLNFTVTVMLGYFAGLILKNGKSTQNRKWLTLVLGGVALIIAAKIMGIWHPIIKRVWSSSMTLLSGGICWIMMGVFYLIVDVWEWKGLNWLKPLGCNSIFVYVVGTMLVRRFDSVTNYLLHGFEQWVGPWYPALVRLGTVVLFYCLIKHLYNKKVFFKV